MDLPRYAIAYGVRGFGKVSHIRVCVTRVEGSYVWCRTASLRDAGTPLVLDLSQIEWESDWQDEADRENSGWESVHRL